MNIRSFNPLQWIYMMAAAIIIGGAIYAATTWNDTPEQIITIKKHIPHSEQLPDQSHMVQGLQAQPTGQTNSVQLQTPGTNNIQSSSQAPSDSTPASNNGACGPPTYKEQAVMCPL